MAESSQPSPPDQPSRQRSPDLIALRAAAGHATPDEARVLANTPQIVGGVPDEQGRMHGGLAVLRPLPLEDWLAKYGGERSDLPAPPDLRTMHDVADRTAEPERPPSTPIGSGIVLAHPDHEPPIPGKPGYRGGRSHRG